MPIEDFIITVFCLIDDECKKIGGSHRLRTRGFEPKLSDSEVITMDVVGEFLGKDTDTGIWRYFKEHWLSWFPELGSRSNYAKQWLTSTRRLVETVIGQLSQQFNIEKVRARDLWHLTSRIGRKVLAHTLGMMVNKILGNPPLQFECLDIV